MKSKMVKLTRQLDEEVQKRDQVSAESQQLERRVQDLTKGASLTSTWHGACARMRPIWAHWYCFSLEA